MFPSCWKHSTSWVPAPNTALAIWRGDEYILSFLFTNQFQFRQANNAKQQSKQWAFVFLISSRIRQTEHRIPPHRQCFNVRRNAKNKYDKSFVKVLRLTCIGAINCGANYCANTNIISNFRATMIAKKVNLWQNKFGLLTKIHQQTTR